MLTQKGMMTKTFADSASIEQGPSILTWRGTRPITAFCKAFIVSLV
jgi:hypothetical protein